MLSYALRRLASALPTLFIIITIAFFMMRLAPGGPFDREKQLPPEIAILLIEHDMDLVFRFAKEITVLVLGAVLTSGTPAEIAANPEVRSVYLGRSQQV